MALSANYYFFVKFLNPPWTPLDPVGPLILPSLQDCSAFTSHSGLSSQPSSEVSNYTGRTGWKPLKYVGNTERVNPLAPACQGHQGCGVRFNCLFNN